MNTDNNLILAQAELLYHVKPVKNITTGYSGNRIFEVKTEQAGYILRASEYSREKEKHIAFELKWMEFLSDHLTAIVRPQKSVNGSLYEVITADNTAYILCLFEKAHGKTVDVANPQEFNETLYFNLGALMGSMHRLTVGYEGNIRGPEFEWNSPVSSWRMSTVILDEKVRFCQQAYYDEIRALPIDKDNYGIIHWDIHADNFFVDHGSIKLFDFDACQFNWYTADMASAIFFMVQKGAGPLMYKSEKERTEFAETYLISYLKGYLQTNRTSAYWIRNIDLFIKYQMGDEYLFAQDGWPQDLAHLRDWYLDWHKERIINDLPYVSINYDKIIKSINL